MVIYRIVLSIRGDSFSPQQMFEKIESDCNIISFHEPTDIPERLDITYGYGAVDFMHPLEFGLHHNGNEYQKWYLDLLVKNYVLFKELGAEDIVLETDLYFVDQCFVEILDKEILSCLSFLNIDNLSLPLNVYKLKSNEEVIEMLLNVGYSQDTIDEVYHL
jgi:hypothetical protein